jgi:hypothetical protein
MSAPALPDGWAWVTGYGSPIATESATNSTAELDGDLISMFVGDGTYIDLDIDDLIQIREAIRALESLPYEDQNAAAKAANQLQKDVTK